jgi:hypothetical protein
LTQRRDELGAYCAKNILAVIGVGYQGSYTLSGAHLHLLIYISTTLALILSSICDRWKWFMCLFRQIYQTWSICCGSWLDDLGVAAFAPDPLRGI